MSTSGTPGAVGSPLATTAALLGAGTPGGGTSAAPPPPSPHLPGSGSALSSPKSPGEERGNSGGGLHVSFARDGLRSPSGVAPSGGGGSGSPGEWDAGTAALGREVIADFLRSSRAYDVVAASGRVLVFDVDVPLRLAFYALVEHDSPCAPLWDSATGQLCGTLTSSDLCDIMRIFHVTGTQATGAALSEFTIAAWRAFAGSEEGLRRGLTTPDLSSRLGSHSNLQELAFASAHTSRVASDSDGEEGVEGEAEALTATAPATAAAGSSASYASRPVPAPLSTLAAASGGRAGASGGESDISMVEGGGEVPFEESGRRGLPLGRHSHTPNPNPNKLLPTLVSIHPEDNLLVVAGKLLAYNIHHMPMVDPEQNAVVAVLSYRTLFTHIADKYTDTRRLFDQPLCTLGIGSYGPDIIIVPESASVISVLHVLAERRISSVPIVTADESRTLVDLYSREDVAFLANDPSLMVLDAPVGDVRRAQIQMVRDVALPCLL